jgi:hypothetical protein
MWTPLLRAPIWVRASIAGIIYGAFMFVWWQLRSDRPSTALSAAIWIVGGALFGLFIGWTIRRRERRMAEAGDRPLDDRQRIAAYQALKNGRLPDDPRARDAAVHLARSEFRGANNPAILVVLVIVLGSLAAWLAVTGQPLWWLGVVFWIVAGIGMLHVRRRARSRANQLLAAAGDTSL